MPTRELLAASQRAQFTDFTAPLDDRTLARFYTLSDDDQIVNLWLYGRSPNPMCLHCQ